MNENSEPIGFLDSGIGGITVLNKALKLMPGENYIFYSDSQNNPYGDKSDAEIKSLCRRTVDYFVNERKCKAVVLACNTASAKAAKYLRAQFPSVPIVAIEPAYKMVHDSAPGGGTLIMATKGTVKSEKFRRLYYSYYDHCTYLHSCNGLADLIEGGNREEIREYLSKNLAPYKGRVQNVVLGCTHYPLIKKEISEVLGDVRFFDGADGVSRRLYDLLGRAGMLGCGNGNVEFIDSSCSAAKRAEKEKRFYELLGNVNGEI